MHILITRAEPAASRTAMALHDLGYRPFVFPLSEVVDTGHEMPVSNFDGYVFTSSNAVRILKSRGWNCGEREIVAYCVGDRTADAANSLGFSQTVSSGGNAENLAELIRMEGEKRPLRLAYPAGVQRSFDIEGVLAGSAVEVETVEIYEVKSIIPPPSEIEKLFSKLGSGIVLLYSHNTAKHVCDVLFGRAGRKLAHRFSVIAISTKTAEAVLKYPWQDVYVADEPTEQSMVMKLNQLSHK
ncbi:MAG: uroporphyrinogen-III synthase [Rhizobiaceae bacterium]